MTVCIYVNRTPLTASQISTVACIGADTNTLGSQEGIRTELRHLLRHNYVTRHVPIDVPAPVTSSPFLFYIITIV
jgi:hypothetical protein